MNLVKCVVCSRLKMRHTDNYENRSFDTDPKDAAHLGIDLSSNSPSYFHSEPTCSINTMHISLMRKRWDFLWMYYLISVTIIYLRLSTSEFILLVMPLILTRAQSSWLSSSLQVRQSESLQMRDRCSHLGLTHILWMGLWDWHLRSLVSARENFPMSL